MQELDDGSRFPVPDPTKLTMDAVNALRAELTDLFDARLIAEVALTAERFRSYEEKLTVLERLRVEQKIDTKVAVDAALAAQKEELKGQRETFATAVAAQGTRYDDLAERLTRAEALKAGAHELSSAVYAALGLGAAIIVALTVLAGFLLANRPGV